MTLFLPFYAKKPKHSSDLRNMYVCTKTGMLMKKKYKRKKSVSAPI